MQPTPTHTQNSGLVKPITRTRISVIAMMLAAGLALAIFISLCVGSTSIPLREIVGRLAALLAPRAALDETQIILFSIRLPRILLAALVGAALATAGAAFQALLRNPLADPYILGISSGASLGAILVTMGQSLAPAGFWSAGYLTRPAGAFLGAWMAVGLVYLVAGGRRAGSSLRLLLAGVVISSLLMAVNIFLLTTARQMELRGFFFWLVGDLSHPIRLDHSFAIVLIAVLASAAVIYSLSRHLNLLATGEEDARALGVPVERVQTTIYLMASLMTGAVVSISGSIPYIGLIIPHIVRLCLGNDHRLLLPSVFFAGAIFTALADSLARTLISPSELPVGVITAICGAPIFLYLLRKRGV